LRLKCSTALTERIDRLTDALVDRLIDRDAFSERRKRLALEEEASEVERLEMGNRAEKAAHMRSLAELAKSLCLSHRLADAAEKRRLVEMTTSNRQIGSLRLKTPKVSSVVHHTETGAEGYEPCLWTILCAADRERHRRSHLRG
jgi:hypothetical protein